ncbi:MAG: ERCC4 domain-containing protein [Candidatus Micrarchaeota archaeon]
MMEEPVVRIAIDKREEGFAELLKGLGAEVEEGTLPVADFVCSERVAVERKTRDDFEKSVMDMRLFEQLKRLKESYPRVVVIVEGEGGAGILTKESLMGAYSSVLADFGASIFFTRNPEKTAELIFHIAKHEQLAEKKPMRVTGARKGLTISQNQKAIVEMLPMIGPKIADSLLEHFGSVGAVFDASEDELLKVEGLGKTRARAIRNVIEKRYEKPASTSSGY